MEMMLLAAHKMLDCNDDATDCEAVARMGVKCAAGLALI